MTDAVKRVGTDPRMDEDEIIRLLRSQPSYDTIGVLQAGTAQALLDMYDRGMTRKEFCENASTALALYSQCAKLWLLKNIQMANERRPLTEEDFKVAHDGIVDILRLQVDELVTQVKRLRECPTAGDPIH